MRNLLMAAALLAGFGLTPATRAQDAKQAPCGKDLICASAPQTVFAAMEKAGYKPTMGKDGEGDPMIESDEAAYHFDVYFYGCDKQHANCDSLRFEALFEKAPENTPEFANKWNRAKRFLQAHIRDDQQMAVAYDLATVGGLNQRNFADVLDWWSSQLDELAKFFKTELNLPEAPAAKK